jgi:hypothetical protein
MIARTSGTPRRNIPGKSLPTGANFATATPAAAVRTDTAYGNRSGANVIL